MVVKRKGKGTCSCIIHIELVDRSLEGKKKHINYTKNNFDAEEESKQLLDPTLTQVIIILPKTVEKK